MKRKKDEAPPFKYPKNEILKLWVRAGGRCEYKGCNEYLLVDEDTGFDVLIGDNAHIVARKKSGPRGKDRKPFSKRNQAENLILLCSKHHNKIIDKGKLLSNFPKEKLLLYKKDHEQRIKLLTGINKRSATNVIYMNGNIRGDKALIPINDINDAIFFDEGKFINCRHEIDLTQFLEKSGDYWSVCKEKIKHEVKEFFKTCSGEVNHISIFGLSRIPLLFFLGFVIGDKIKMEIYQKQRDGEEGWLWKRPDGSEGFELREIKQDLKAKRTNLILSLSGKINEKSLLKDNKLIGSVFEIKPKNKECGRDVIKSKEDLYSFIKCYQKFLRLVEKCNVAEIHVFPAIPVSVAIACGRVHLKGIGPKIKIYDANKQNKFKFAMEV